jgi:hypothetical protein
MEPGSWYALRNYKLVVGMEPGSWYALSNCKFGIVV